MYAWNSPFDGKLVSKCNWKSIFLGSSFMYSFTSWVVLVVNCFTSIVKKFNYFFNNFSFPCNTISTTAETSVCFLFLFFLLNPNSRFWNFIHEQYWSLFFFFLQSLMHERAVMVVGEIWRLLGVRVKLKQVI